jgi:phosphatidylserine decarboxylase
MAEVSSCNPIVNEGDFVEKGQDVGHFEFGGSSHLLIFEKGVELAFNPKIYEVDETGSLVKQLVNSTLATVIPK